MKTLADKFKSLRADRGLSLADVGKRAGLERTTVWKIEHGFWPRGETLKAAVQLGLGVRVSSPEWQEVQALWAGQRVGQAINSKSLAKRMDLQDLKRSQDVDRLLAKLAKLPSKQWDQIEKAISRPAVMRGLANLNALYEGKGS